MFSTTTTLDVPMICVQIPICYRCSYSSASMRGSDRPAIFINVQFGNIPNALQNSRFAPIYHGIIFLHSTVIKVEDQDILRAYADELIHHIGHLGPLYHRADSNPISVF